MATTTAQRPIGSGFNAASRASDVIAGHDLSGKTVIVTGGYSGLGLETAKALASAGASVIVPVRDRARGGKALAPYPDLVPEYLDLADPGSIDALAARYLASGRPLHMLINCAGVMATPLTRDDRGHEIQFSTNHLGHFQLTARLWPALVKALGARVVSVSSRAHFMAPVDLEDPDFKHRAYDPWIAYGQSKTANILFARELDNLSQAVGLRAFSVHPGAIVTNLGRHLPAEATRAMGAVDDEGRPIIDPDRGMKTPEQGAATIVWCAVSAQLEGSGGVYCEDCDIAIETPPDVQRGGPGVRHWATDPDAAKRLWKLSEECTNVTFAV